jgi:hypothetical protein
MVLQQFLCCFSGSSAETSEPRVVWENGIENCVVKPTPSFDVEASEESWRSTRSFFSECESQRSAEEPQQVNMAFLLDDYFGFLLPGLRPVLIFCVFYLPGLEWKQQQQ